MSLYLDDYKNEINMYYLLDRLILHCDIMQYVIFFSKKKKETERHHKLSHRIVR